MVPDFFPTVFEDVTNAFEIALAWVNMSFRAYTHIYSCGGARLHA
jgi:hypothetical protein